MNRYALKGGLCFAALFIGCAQPANAAMACWDQTHSAAAKIRDLQSRLMVATMRCQAMGINVLSAYNEFVTTNRPTLQAANGVIKAQFANSYGPAAEREYDRFTTALANAYGADATSLEVCEETAALAAEAVAAKGDVSMLLDIAERAEVSPELPGGICLISFAGVTGE